MSQAWPFINKHIMFQDPNQNQSIECFNLLFFYLFLNKVIRPLQTLYIKIFSYILSNIINTSQQQLVRMTGKYLVIISILISLFIISEAQFYSVSVVKRDQSPLLSYFVQNNSIYKQVFNPTWIQPTEGTGFRKGILARTQDCQYNEDNKCVFCGGAASKASILTFSQDKQGKFTPITKDSISFTPSSFEDSWGTQDPRMIYNKEDGYYYMMYTAYNGSSILLSLAKTKNPFDRNSWTKLGPVFPNYQNSKSGAILIRNQPPHYLFWGDSDIRVAKSNNISSWPTIGDIFLSPRPNSFDSKLVESGPPPLLLQNGNYLFIYNSAEKGWPQDRNTAYHVGWLILDGKDPTKILARSTSPLMGPIYNWQKGEKPYLCNVPNVVFLQAAEPLGNDTFRVFFGAGDATIGSAVIKVSSSNSLASQQ